MNRLLEVFKMTVNQFNFRITPDTKELIATLSGIFVFTYGLVYFLLEILHLSRLLTIGIAVVSTLVFTVLWIMIVDNIKKVYWNES